MLLHVLVLGSITAAHITTNQAHPQIWPTIPRVDTILADIRAWFTDLDQMLVKASLRISSGMLKLGVLGIG